VRLLFRGLIFLCLGCLCAEDEGILRKWRLSGGVGKMFDTPIGAVYRVEPGEVYFIPDMNYSKRKEWERNKRDMPQMGGLLYVSFLADNKPTKRIVVIDFKIRLYPVFSKKGSPDFEFSLVRSENSEMQNDYRMLNGLLMIRSNSGVFLSSSYCPMYPVVMVYRNNPRFRPDFEPLSMRVIFDTTTEEVVTSFNGQNEVHTTRARVKNWPKENIDSSLAASHYGNSASGNNAPAKVRSLGILCMASKVGDKPQFLEISSPVIRLFDKIEETKDLQPALFSPYPYGQYLPESKKTIGNAEELIRLAHRDKNPEVQYAVALRLLYGNEDYCYPVEAIRLLEKAAQDGHVLAFYQLGVCYYRGYGVAVDTKKALRYLRNASDFNYQNAEALEWFIEWDQAHRPYFMVEDFIKKIEKLQDKYIHFEHDARHLRGVVCAIYGALGYEPYSLKDVLGLGYVNSWINKNEQMQPKYFIDQAINLGYASAYVAKARYFKGLDNTEKLRLLKEGVKAGDTAAIPEMLLAMGRNNQLSLDEFTVERDLIFADHALYQFLARVMKNPDDPSVKAFLAGDNTKAIKLLENSSFPDKHLLLGLLGIIGQLPPRSGLKKNAVSSETIMYLIQAAAAADPMAQYILASRHFRNDLPEKEIKGVKFNPHELLLSACKQGDLKAAMLMAELEQHSNTTNALNCLEKVCMTDYAPAFFLKGQILQRLGRQKEAEQAFQKTVELGDYRGLQMLARFSRNNPKLEQKLWYEYIQADLRSRTLDHYDPYFPQLYRDLYKWKQIDSTPPNKAQDKMQDSWRNQKVEEIKKYQRKR
jgi:TPR repeat protein